MLSPADIARELVRLKHLADTTADGTPDGLGETDAALFDYFEDHFDVIIETLLQH